MQALWLFMWFQPLPQPPRRRGDISYFLDFLSIQTILTV